MKRLLMIAYHFPPLAGSSGIQRSLRFAQQLPGHGWQPAVLSVNTRAYEQTGSDLLAELPADLEVVRAFALDASRHLAIAGRYPGWLARPDRWLSWLLGAVPAGLAMIRRHRPAAIWSTYPIASAHLLGYSLSRLSGLPWVADFRDPMAHEGYPADARTWQSYLSVEKKVFSRACRAVFATPGAARLYRQRYPVQAERIRVIENGYDEDAFRRASDQPHGAALNPGSLTLLHSGIVYPEWRNPSGLFEALQRLLSAGAIRPQTLRLRFRAPVHDRWLADLAERHGLGFMVEILPPLPYIDALTEMLAADALLALQSADCNDQVPAKVYEYLRARKAILGLADPQGDTAGILRTAAMGPICALEAPAEQIGEALLSLLASLNGGASPVADEHLVGTASREARTAALAGLLNEITVAAGSPSGLKSNLSKP
ncbi:glycosyltransferase [Paucibacter sp. O1-1]|nr:glycosyltransferase [Paucibacter sp. O1-1]MDA3830661.1 glycosyltransferase [Paucibacter sp. O1-1]